MAEALNHPADTIPQESPPDQYPIPICRILWDAVVILQAKVILEIGTCGGDSARIFSAALRETGGHLYSLDHSGARGDWPEKWDCSNITFLVGNSLSYPWEKELDLLYIDGDHTYATVFSDLTRFAPWVRPGGKILLHDTRLEGTDFSVRKAIFDWTGQHLLPWTEYPHVYGLGIIEIAERIPPS